jgi:cobalt-zinc-cadmium resistance protein CzcA
MEQVTSLPMLSINPQREHLTLLGLDIATLQNA